MASCESRFLQLVYDNLEVDGQPLPRPLNLDTNILDSGVSSLDAVAFFRHLMKEFSVRIRPEAVAQISSWRNLIDYIDENAD